MKFTQTKIKDVYIIDLEPKQDSRGYFSRVFCKQELEDVNIDFSIVQINRSKTVQKGTIRGLHMQQEPHAEVKLVQCLQGAVFDVVVDMRPNSETYLQWVSQELGAQNMNLMLVPKGCAHGFQTLETDCIVEYFVSELYSPDSEKGFLWNDPKLNIPWPIQDAILSEKDKSWKLL